MSYLSRPRISFFSRDATVNPSTANNNYVFYALDYGTVELQNPPPIVGASLPEMSDAAYREWMTSLVAFSDPVDQIPDPTRPDWQPTMGGSWNYWGDHLATFGTASVTSVLVDGDPVTRPSDDALVGTNLVFNARMADLDPGDTFCTQFVPAGLSLLGRDAEGGITEILRGVPTTAYTRFFNLHRIRGAGSFFAVIPNAALEFADESVISDSRGLRALREGAGNGGGLVLRWCYYGMESRMDVLEMYDRTQRGEEPVNPKIGRVVGSIGVWNGEDVRSAPVGRMLQRPGPPYFATDDENAEESKAVRVKSHGDVERAHKPGTVLNAQVADTACEDSVGPAMAVVEHDRVVLDMGTTFPEAGCDPAAERGSWSKHDFGVVRLELEAVGGGVEPLGEVAYDAETYESLGGTWEVPIDPGPETRRRIAEGALRLCIAGGDVLLREIDCAQVVTDDQAVYLDMQVAAGGPIARGRARLRVFRKGEPLPDHETVHVEVWKTYQGPSKANSVNPLVLMAADVSEQKVGSFTVDIPEGGVADVPIDATEPGSYKLRYVAPGMHVEGGSPHWSVEQYSCYRVLPHDDYSNVPDDQITYEFVYKEVLSYYAILYPVMAKIIPWGPENAPPDAERVGEFAGLIRQAIDERRLGTALAMPITRELSAGKRALLRRWCDLQLQG